MTCSPLWRHCISNVKMNLALLQLHDGVAHLLYMRWGNANHLQQHCFTPFCAQECTWHTRAPAQDHRIPAESNGHTRNVETPLRLQSTLQCTVYATLYMPARGSMKQRAGPASLHGEAANGTLLSRTRGSAGTLRSASSINKICQKGRSRICTAHSTKCLLSNSSL